MAARASLQIQGTDETPRTVALADFYRLPGSTPHLETVLRPGDVITAILVPAAAANVRATYVKVRDRQSYAYALASVAAGVEMQDGVIREARLAAGGVGTRPWRLDAVEAALAGKRPTSDVIAQAAAHAADGAHPQSQNAFKVRLLQQTVRAALHSVTA